MRLLSFLSDIESALGAIDPAPRGGAWEAARMVNTTLGVAKLYLKARYNPSRIESLGGVQLQSHQLADGSVCLKAFLSWNGRDSESVHAIYDRPQLDWSGEARRLAEAWLSGSKVAEPVAYESLAAAS